MGCGASKGQAEAPRLKELAKCCLFKRYSRGYAPDSVHVKQQKAILKDSPYVSQARRRLASAARRPSKLPTTTPQLGASG